MFAVSGYGVLIFCTSASSLQPVLNLKKRTTGTAIDCGRRTMTATLRTACEKACATALAIGIAFGVVDIAQRTTHMASLQLDIAIVSAGGRNPCVKRELDRHNSYWWSNFCCGGFFSKY